MPSREEERFEATVLPHLDDAYTFARYLLRDEHDAQDAVQDAALRALRHFGGYREGDGRAWLLAIVRNCCLTMRQRRATEPIPLTEDRLARAQSASSPTDARAILSSERTLLRKALAGLPPEFREVVVLREVHELSYREISEIVGAPMGTVMSRLSRGRERLARALRGTREVV